MIVEFMEEVLLAFYNIKINFMYCLGSIYFLINLLDLIVGLVLSYLKFLFFLYLFINLI